MWIVFRCIWALGLSKVLRDSLSRPGCVEQQRQAYGAFTSLTHLPAIPLFLLQKAFYSIL
jgi:hypothetical protein